MRTVFLPGGTKEIPNISAQEISARKPDMRKRNTGENVLISQDHNKFVIIIIRQNSYCIGITDRDNVRLSTIKPGSMAGDFGEVAGRVAILPARLSISRNRGGVDSGCLLRGQCDLEPRPALLCGLCPRRIDLVNTAKDGL